MNFQAHQSQVENFQKILTFSPMFLRIMLIFLVINGPVIAFSQELKIVITNINNPNTPIRIGLYNSSSVFPKEDQAIKAQEVTPNKKGSIVITFLNIPYGEYALALFQDNNRNQLLDTNLFGIPKEPYGFSKNIKPKLSAPEFNECKITFSKDSHTFTISLIN